MNDNGGNGKSIIDALVVENTNTTNPSVVNNSLCYINSIKHHSRICLDEKALKATWPKEKKPQLFKI